MADCADNVFRQKAVIQFLTKEGATAKNISDRLKIVYGENSLSYTSVKRWVVHFKNGNDDICDKLRQGRPPSAATADNKALVDGLIRSDRRVSCRIIAQSLGIGHSTVQTIISELGYSKVYARWVPRLMNLSLRGLTCAPTCFSVMHRKG